MPPSIRDKISHELVPAPITEHLSRSDLHESQKTASVSILAKEMSQTESMVERIKSRVS